MQNEENTNTCQVDNSTGDAEVVCDREMVGQKSAQGDDCVTKKRAGLARTLSAVLLVLVGGLASLTGVCLWGSLAAVWTRIYFPLQWPFVTTKRSNDRTCRYTGYKETQ